MALAPSSPLEPYSLDTAGGRPGEWLEHFFIAGGKREGGEAVGAGGSISWSHLGHEKAGGREWKWWWYLPERGGCGGGAIRCGREHTQGCKTRAKERTNLEGSPLSSLPSSSSSSKTTTLTIPTPSPGLKVDVVCGGVTTLLPTEPAIGHAKNQTLATPEKRSRALFSPLLQPLSPPQLEFVSKTKAAPFASASTTCPARKRLWISSHAAEVRERGGGFFSLFQKLGPIFVMFSSSSSSSSLFFVRWWWAKMTRERRRRRGFFPRTKQSWLARLLLRGTNAEEGKRASRGGGNSGRLFGRKSGK